MKPFSTILVGFDGSSRSAEAARQALALARESGGGHIILAYVSAALDDIPGVPDVVVAAHRRLVAARRVTDRQRLIELRHQLSGDGIEVTHVVVEGSADSTLAGLAHQHRADLIVVGSHGRTGLRHFVMGSVAERTLRLAEISVLVVRGEPRAHFREIVVGTDFSPYSTPAFERARAIAAPGATVRVVHAWHAPSDRDDRADDVSLVRNGLASASAEQGAALVTRHPDPLVRVTFESMEGMPAEVICRAAATDDAELVVVGSHGYRGLRHFVLGSVAEDVVRHAPCSVLVAR